jgi:predicted RNA-binding protein
MVSYSLEEFKAWLEADESRKEGLDWYTHREYFLYWESYPNHFENQFVKTAKGEPGGGYKAGNYLPYINVGKKWVAYMEQRERERERESKMKGIIW